MVSIDARSENVSGGEIRSRLLGAGERFRGEIYLDEAGNLGGFRPL